MRKRTRYLLLVVGFIIFIFLAPIIILYVRGISYDFKNREFVQTGILNVKVDPNKVDIYINNILKEKKSGDINFLKPGDYNVALKKDGYFPWQKRLTIQAGMVTWASPQNSNVYLLKQTTSRKIASEVLDFVSKNSNVVYLTNSNIFYGKIDSVFNKTALFKPVNKIISLDNENYILTNTIVPNSSPILFNSSTGLLTDLKTIFSTLPENISYNNNEFYYLENEQLLTYNINSQEKNIILNNIRNFYFQDNNLYYIQKNNNKNNLYVSISPFNQPQLLSINIPEFLKVDIFVSYSKQIYILADNTLYKLNSNFDKITDNIANFEFDFNGQNLPLLRYGEFNYYDFNSQNLNFVTRKNEHVSNLVVKSNIGYAFYKNTTGIYAIELDTRDSQNQYLISQGDNISKFNFYNSDKNIIYLENGSLNTIDIR